MVQEPHVERDFHFIGNVKNAFISYLLSNPDTSRNLIDLLVIGVDDSAAAANSPTREFSLDDRNRS